MNKFGYTQMGFQTALKLKAKLSSTQHDILQAKFPNLLMIRYEHRNSFYTKIIGAMDSQLISDFHWEFTKAQKYSALNRIMTEIDAMENPHPYQMEEAFLPA